MSKKCRKGAHLCEGKPCTMRKKELLEKRKEEATENARRRTLYKMGEAMTIKDLACICAGMGVELHFSLAPAGR